MEHKFGLSETEKYYKQMQDCRDIVKKIMDFGVSQKQVMRLIYLLSLELENNDHMTKIS